MRSIKEISKIKEALLADNDLRLKGQVPVGNGTQWYGPYTEPAKTYVDGMYWGEDGTSGNLFGDSWNVRQRGGEESPISTGAATMYVTTK